MDQRFCDLKLTIQGPLRQRVQQVHAELRARGLTRLRPHVWLSTEWFSPDGIPGIALPFYLAHPRLIRLERSQMLAVEGGSPASCLRILRHETGHCFDTAYRLHRRQRYRELFGRYHAPYPETYKPRPGSRRYVTHLPGWYTQAHPAEDFAETFIPGRELYVGVTGNYRLSTLPPREVFFDKLRNGAPKITTRKVKWDDNYQKKIGLSTGPAKPLPKFAKRTYRALPLSGYARMDFPITDGGQAHLLEANPNPQIMYGEDFAESAEHRRLSYQKLLEKILNLGHKYLLAWQT